MKLRKWQKDAIDQALRQYKSGLNHFLALATPGAGKTIYGAKLARALFDNNLIDLVLCFSPTSMVADDFGSALETEFSANFDGKLGAKGHSTTYQNMRFMNESFWNVLESFRVFVIFDEIHHCSGTTTDNANAWGESIIVNIQQKSAYTLALTGTPWRSDNMPIVLSRYCDDSGNIICDFTYGLREAIQDSVCRTPQITALDNDDIQISEKGEISTFPSLTDALTNNSVPYQNVIENDVVISELISRANLKLNELRSRNDRAGGLIVTSSVEHALLVKSILKTKFYEDSTIVTYREELPNQIIKNFRRQGSKWLISVGMVSEGTNIPRLQVCVHLTNIKTELHFRQILGRVLRYTGTTDLNGYLFMLAHPQLLDFAYRVSEDIPDCRVIHKTQIDSVLNLKKNRNGYPPNISDIAHEDDSICEEDKHSATLIRFNGNLIEYDSLCPLSNSYEKVVGIFGRFKEEILELGISNELASD